MEKGADYAFTLGRKIQLKESSLRTWINEWARDK